MIYLICFFFITIIFKLFILQRISNFTSEIYYKNLRKGCKFNSQEANNPHKESQERKVVQKI